jgi:hypothetical protein
MSISREGLHRRWAALAGYYSPSEGARYVSPLVSGTKFPHLVEMHESMHRYLALNNYTDGYGRLLTAFLQQEELREDHRKLIYALMQTIDDTTSYCHELVATYSSFQMLALASSPAEVTGARKELPGSYAALLDAGEEAFGRLGNDSAESMAKIVMVVLACAIAALNLPYEMERASFGQIVRVREFIADNSPDQRFKAILGRFTPPDSPGSVLVELPNIGNEDVQAFTFNIIRRLVPTLRFIVVDPERPTLLRQWFSDWRMECEKYGYTFMRDAEILDQPEDVAIEQMGAQLDMPALSEAWPAVNEALPLDLMLTIPQKFERNLRRLAAEARALAIRGGRLYVTVTPIGERSETLLVYFPYKKKFKAAYIISTFGEILGALSLTPPGLHCSQGR